MFYRKIILILIAIIALFSIIAVNADENSQNFIADSDNTTILNSADRDIEVNSDITLMPTKLLTAYQSMKYFKVKMTDGKTKKPVVNMKFSLKTFIPLKNNESRTDNINTKFLKEGLYKMTVNVKESSKVKKASDKSTIDSPKYIKIKVNGKVLNVKLENNKATETLMDKLNNGDIKINAREYGGFEKVGNLGFTLPASDQYIETSPGDLVLYQGNQISLFYDSNSWNYTKLGEVQNVNEKELKNILGNDDVELILSLK